MIAPAWFRGIYDLGPLCLALTDQGISVAWRQVVVWEWAAKEIT